jgi:hypothetical protein
MNIYSYKNLELNGRLGNQLWQIASTAGIAKSKGGIPAFSPKWEYRKYFNVPDSLFRQVPHNSIDGGTAYLQELHYFSNIEDEVKKWYTPSDISKQHIEKFYSQFLNESTKAAVHVRRGDYLKYPKHFPLPSKNYYLKAIEDIKNKDPEVEIFIFSDDPRWAKKEFPEHNVIIGHPRPVEVKDRKGEPLDQYDLFCMNLCDYHVISNSTFSWWGAYLAKSKQVIYPSVWFGPELNTIPWRLMIPEEWIELNANH